MRGGGSGGGGGVEDMEAGPGAWHQVSLLKYGPEGRHANVDRGWPSTSSVARFSGMGLGGADFSLDDALLSYTACDTNLPGGLQAREAARPQGGGAAVAQGGGVRKPAPARGASSLNKEAAARLRACGVADAEGAWEAALASSAGQEALRAWQGVKLAVMREKEEMMEQMRKRAEAVKQRDGAGAKMEISLEDVLAHTMGCAKRDREAESAFVARMEDLAGTLGKEQGAGGRGRTDADGRAKPKPAEPAQANG